MEERVKAAIAQKDASIHSLRDQLAHAHAQLHATQQQLHATQQEILSMG